MSNLFTFGIDLGTTNSCISRSENNIPNIIPNEDGNRLTPSIVSFKDNQVNIGAVALNGISSNVENTVYSVKRLIGHKYSEKGVQDDISGFGFKVEPDNNDNPIISVTYKRKNEKFTPQQISHFVLEELKKHALEKYGKNDCKCHAVITVPAYFNDVQRKATIEAGQLAGLNILQIVNEPTAAAIAYGYKYVSEKANSTILVYDFGGGTFDVSIIEVKNNEITVKATDGDSHLGGDDIDKNLVDYYSHKLLEDAGIDISKDKKKLWKLTKSCKEAKQNLTDMEEVCIDSNILEENDIDTSLTRTLFNKLNEDIFNKTIDIVKRALSNSHYSKEQIKDIVLIGGSSRIPMVQELLLELFPDHTLNKDINPDEAVAIGASLLAEDLAKGIIEQQSRVDPNEIVLIDTISRKEIKEHKKVIYDEVTGQRRDEIGYCGTIKGPLSSIDVIEVLSQSIGIELYDGRMDFVLKKNIKIPSTHKTRTYNVYDNKTELDWDFYQGDDKIAKNNRLLYKYKMENLPPKKAGEMDFECVMTINGNGLIDVKVTESHGYVNETNLKITNGNI